MSMCKCLWTKEKDQGLSKISQTSVDSSIEPPLKRWAEDEHCSPAATQTPNCKKKLPLHFQQCLYNASTGDIQRKLESAEEKETDRGWSSWETEPAKCFFWEVVLITDGILQVLTGYHRILEKQHSFPAAGLLIHRIALIPHYQVITESFCTARAPLTSSVRLFIAAAAQAESGILT